MVSAYIDSIAAIRTQQMALVEIALFEDDRI